MKPELLLRVAPGSVRVTPASGAATWETVVEYASADELGSAIRQAASASRPRGRTATVRIAIHPSLVQQRTLSDLPPVSAPALRELVARGTSRFFRQNGHPLVSGAIWSADRSSPRTATVAAIDGVLASSMVAATVEAGWRLVDIVPEQGPVGLSLLPREERRRQQGSEWRGVLRLAWVALAAWLLVLALLGGRTWLELRRTESELAGLREPRAALITARRAMENASAMVIVMNDAERARSQATGWVSQVLMALPDSVLLEELAVDRDGRGMIRGRAMDLPALLDRLRKIDGLTVSAPVGQPAGDGPVAQWQGFSVELGQGDQ